MKKQQNKWQKKSKRDIETYDRTEKQHLISQINGNFALEGMSLTEKDKQELKDVLDGKLTYENAIGNIVNECKQR